MSEVSLDNIFFTEGYCASDPQDAQGNEIHRSQIQWELYNPKLQLMLQEQVKLSCIEKSYAGT